MLKDERLKQITAMLHTNGKVEVSNLCRLFNVTEMTIRRDLGDLVQRKFAVRSHGGAILAPDMMMAERPYELRISHNLHEKEAIAREAMQFIQDGDCIYFDSSTTVYCLARLISNMQKFIAVTDTVSTAIELNARTNVRVLCLGGELKKNTGSCTGSFAEDMLKSMRFSTAFIGLSRVSVSGLLSTSNMSERTIKRTVIDRAKRVILLVDSSKIGDSDFLEIGHLSDADTLIMDSNISPEFLEFCKTQDIHTIIAPV